RGRSPPVPRRRSRAAMRSAPASDLHPELRAEAHVPLDDLVPVLYAVPQHQAALDPHPEGEAAVAVGVDAAGLQHLAVDHAAAAPLDPACAAAGAAGVVR